MTSDTPEKHLIGSESPRQREKVFVPRKGPRSIDTPAISHGVLVRDDGKEAEVLVREGSGQPKKEIYSARELEEFDRLNVTHSKALAYLFSAVNRETTKTMYGQRVDAVGSIRQSGAYQEAVGMINKISAGEPDCARVLTDYFTRGALESAKGHGINAGSLTELGIVLDQRTQELVHKIESAESQITELTRAKQVRGIAVPELQAKEGEILELHNEKAIMSDALRALEKVVEVFGIALFYDERSKDGKKQK